MLSKRRLQVELANRRETLEDRKRKREDRKAAPAETVKSRQPIQAKPHSQQPVPREAAAADAGHQARKAHIRAVALGGFDVASKEEVVQYARSLPGVSYLAYPCVSACNVMVVVVFDRWGHA